MTDSQAISQLTVRYRDTAYDLLADAADDAEWMLRAKQFMQECVNKLKAAPSGDEDLPGVPDPPS